jgi:phosphoglycolate phosphatase
VAPAGPVVAWLFNGGHRLSCANCNTQLCTILFDFDYTLADSSPGVHECINYALGKLGLPAVSYDVACRTIGLSLPATLVRLAGAEQAARAPEYVRAFTARADQVMADSTALLDPVPAAIRRLRAQGLRLGIVSTKYRYRIATVLQRDDLLSCFDVIIGGEDVAAHKPDPAGLHMALARLACPVNAALYVGDSVVDAETAERASVRFLAVLSGVTPRDAFAPYPAWSMLDDLAGLPDLLAAQNKAD